jgi:hypothetical protein
MGTRRLSDPAFEATFIGHIGVDGKSWRHLSSIDGAQGLLLMECPCGGGHALEVPFANPRNAPPCPPDFGPLSRDGKTHPRWTMTGTSLDDLSLMPSIDVGTVSCWHGYITAGEVIP